MNTSNSKSVIIHGSSDSRHLYNYIKIILDQKIYQDITIFNTSYVHNIPKFILDYYYDNQINIINIPNILNKKNRHIYSLINFFIKYFHLKKLIKKHGVYDYCIIHYCAWQSVLWLNFTKLYFRKIIAVSYGGDILRNKRLSNWFYMKFFNNCDKIIHPNINTNLVFNNKTHNQFNFKSFTIQFPQQIIKLMDIEKNKYSIETIKNNFKFPTNKLIVICGHTATKAEQYEKMIEHLKSCSLEIIDQCFFVFMMTYAPGDYKDYQMKICELLNKGPLKGVVLTEFLPYDKIIQLHFISNIHITTIITDAFSCFLQEELYAGSLVIYGKWLKYYELEKDNYIAYPINDFNELSSVLQYIVTNYKRLKEESLINIKLIKDLESEESIKYEWSKILL